MKPTVSIITPCYNARPYLPATWRSIKRQTFTDWEWVVWEDGSTDGSAEWLKELAKRDARVRVFRGERTKDPAMGRNHGIQNAQGEYLAFLDADDLWLPKKLEKQLECFRNQDRSIDLVFTWIQEFWSRDSQLTGRPPCVWPRIDPGTHAVDVLLTKGNMVSPSTILMKRRAIESCGMFQPGIPGLEDFEFICRAASKLEIECLPEVLALYRMHQSNLSHRVGKSFEGHERLLYHFEQHNLLQGTVGRSFRSTFHTRRAEHAMETETPIDAKGELVKAWWYQPLSPMRVIPLILLCVPRKALFPVYRFMKRAQSFLQGKKARAHRFSTSWKDSHAKR